MTEEEFDIANERLRSRTGWAGVLVFFPPLAGFFAIGARYQDWFNHHDNLTLLAFGVWIGGFLTAMYFISRWLHKRSGLVCPTCGSRELPAPNGQCWNCNGLPPGDTNVLAGDGDHRPGRRRGRDDRKQETPCSLPCCGSRGLCSYAWGCGG